MVKCLKANVEYNIIGFMTPIASGHGGCSSATISDGMEKPLSSGFRIMMIYILVYHGQWI
jgi:hypothetical protein